MPEPGAGSGGARGGSGMGAGDSGGYGGGPENEADPIGYGIDPGGVQREGWYEGGREGGWINRRVSPPSVVEMYLEDVVPKVAPVARPAPKPTEHEARKQAPRNVPSITEPVSSAPTQPANAPLSSYEVAKTDIEAKKHAAVTMPSDSMASFLLDDDAGLTGGLNIRTTSSGRTSGWKDPNYIDRLAEQKALVDALPDWAQNWRSLLDIRFDKAPSFDDWFKNISPTVLDQKLAAPAVSSRIVPNFRWNTETGWPEKFGIAPNTIGRRISTRAQSEAKRQLEKYGPRFASRFQDLSDQEANIARQVTGMMRAVPSDEDDWFAEDTQAVPAWDRIRHADLLTRAAAINKEKNRFDRLSDPRRVSANPFYDLMRHGFMANETSLPVSQFTEFDSLAQPSDFYNNVLASKFMRPDQKFDLNSSAASMFSPFDTNFFAPPVTNSPYDQQRYQHWENVLGAPMSPSSRIGGPMDAFGKLAFREMMNPGSTGYNFNTNVTDQGLWERPVSDWWNMMKNASGQ